MIHGRHALVTGGVRGIGRATTIALHKAGAKVTVLGRDERALKEMLRDGHAHGYVPADVTNEAQMAEAFADAVEFRGPIDILVANAGGSESAPFQRTDSDAFRRMFELNVMGVVHAVRAVLAGMVARRSGRIVVVASTAGLKGYGYVSAYCAAKHAVVGLVRALAAETASSGITVNAVCPGYTDTDLVRDSVSRVSATTGRPPEEVLARMIESNPLGRLIRPEEVAAAILYLCSPAAAAITGTTLAVAGGEL